jgi:hypothetical protein
MDMATNTPTGSVRQATQDNRSRRLDAVDARGGVVSGRVVTILAVSVLLVAVIFAMLWLTGV